MLPSSRPPPSLRLGSGGISGKGLGNIQMSKHIPEWQNDMVFAGHRRAIRIVRIPAVCLAAYILVLFAARRGNPPPPRANPSAGSSPLRDRRGFLAGQTFLNIAVTLKLMPVTGGATLPFISYGGSSLLASFMAAGFAPQHPGQNRPIVMANNSFEFEEE